MIPEIFFPNGFVNKIAERQIFLTLTLVLWSNEDIATFCYVPYTENPLLINQIHENQIFLQITSFKTSLSTLKVQRSEEMPASPVLMKRFLELSAIKDHLSTPNPADLLVTFQNLSIRLSKKKQTKFFLVPCK